MFRTAARLLEILLTAATIGGTAITAASAGPGRVSRQGTEHLVFMDTSTRSLVFSVLATGMFTDGGTISADAVGNKARIRLGSGTIELRTAGRPATASAALLAWTQSPGTEPTR